MIAFGCGSLASNLTQASVIQSMTIEEIGIASAGLGTSAIASGGGWGNWQNQFGNTTTAPAYFIGNGIDGGIKMGSTQTNGSISQNIVWSGILGNINTLNGAPNGSISGGVMNLDFSGLVAEYFAPINLAFNISPDSDSLITHVAMINASHYYYTADWSHVITSAETPAFAGFPVSWHLEGIATVPEPSTLWLIGASALGLTVSRRRKHA